MTSEKTIVSGVDVSKCKFYRPHDCPTDCEISSSSSCCGDAVNDDCYFKKWQRELGTSLKWKNAYQVKEDALEESEEYSEELEERCRKLEKEINSLKTSLGYAHEIATLWTENDRYATEIENLKTELTDTKRKFDELKIERDKLKTELEEFHDDCKGCATCFNALEGERIYFKEKTEYKKVLIEVRKILKQGLVLHDDIIVNRQKILSVVDTVLDEEDYATE